MQPDPLIDTTKFKRVQDEARATTRTAPERAKIVARASLRLVRDQLKEARILNHTLLCDEAVERGGGGTAPTPLHYFAAATGF
jgi:hypothetical protein